MIGINDPVCRRDAERRRADVLAQPDANGIDFVEVDPDDHRIVNVFFLRSLPPGAYGLTADFTRIRIEGGTRVVGLRTLGAARRPATDGSFYLEISVDRGGDFSAYTLTLDTPNLDVFFRRIKFSFMASCPVDVDCRHEVPCPPPVLAEPDLDYLAKDYSSFRRMLLDLVPQLNPSFLERNPSDIGIALLELLAHEGDHLSYLQDAVANEAFLESLRHRVSARRHARLIDYRMHDGRNAWTWVHLQVSQPCMLEQGTKLASRILAPLAGHAAPPGLELLDGTLTADAMATDAALASVVVFETTHGVALHDANNEIRIHAWGNEECCLVAGTQEAFLYTVPAGSPTAIRPVLAEGDLLLFEEVKGPLTGAAADAGAQHRQVVVIDADPQQTEDPVYADTLIGDEVVRIGPADQPLPLLRVRWRREDALSFPLCLSSRTTERGAVPNVSVARGNVVLADHGLLTDEELEPPYPGAAGPLYLRLSRDPLTMECQPEPPAFDSSSGRPITDRRDLSCSVREARPSVAVLATFPTGTELWTPQPTLLDSTPFDGHFVAEVEDDGTAALRFGDGEYGREPDAALSFRAVYRIGNGITGNVGAESLRHVELRPGSSAAGRLLDVRNPLPARAGLDPETIEEVRRLAPDAFRAEQFRAVTEGDYEKAVKKLPEVSGAAASFRWTGSWYTVFVGVDPVDPADLVVDRTGRMVLSVAIERLVRAFITRYRLAGYDLEIRPPRFVPIELDLEVCALPGHFRTEVGAAVAETLSNRDLPAGGRGFFHPSNFTFGDPVYLSQIYASVERVEGVDSAVVTRFRRFGQPDNGELATGVVATSAWEIAQLENDPNFLEHGVLRITSLGGKG